VATILLGTGGSSGTAWAGPFDKGPYLQNVSRSSVTLMWESSAAVACRVEILGRGDEVDWEIETERDELHEVVVDRLESGRRYRYAVVCDDSRVIGEFATAPEHREPFNFVVFGDSRSNPSSHRTVVERVRREVPDFLVGTGDMVNDGGVEADWERFFEIEREILRENVLFPTLGNHDRQGRGRTADNYRKYFSVPENSPDPERYYAFTYGNSRFLVLDSNAYSFALTDQTAWLESQLQAARVDPKIRHIFVAMHHPPFSISLHGGHSQLRDAWTPLFERYRVDAVFSGHDHCYERGEHGGVRYFVSGGGGAPLYPRSKRAESIDLKAIQYMERVNHYVRVHVVGDYVEVSAFRTDGSVIESVSWGQLPDSSDLVAAFRVGSAQPNATSDGRASADGASSIAPAGAATGRGFGVLGTLGTVLVLLSGAVIVWTLRY
jgi:acid phosphatase type 7